MKLRGIHIFLILILSLLLCRCITSNNVEGLTSKIKHDEYIGPAGDHVDTYKNIEVDTKRHNHIPRHPHGIPKSLIPEEDKHLYILKSEIVPPVCPACPTVSECPREKPCPACPPCARCPEPSFECKKVPNYSSNQNDYLPRPILTDFSQFGM